MTLHSSDQPKRFELVVAQTVDLVRLHGLYRRPATDPCSRIDAAVVLHGLGGNFYNSKLNLRLESCLNELGIATVMGNTRGHDSISMNTVAGRATTIGAAYEIVDDCRHDIAGWVDWLVQQGHQNIALVGHSLGAIKSLYAQANQPLAHVRAVVAVSATGLNHQRFLESDRRDDFLKWFGLASKLVAAGKGKQLLHVDFPFPTHICAEAYFDKYGPEDRYNWTKLAHRIEVPALLVFGELEIRNNPAFQGLLEEIQPLIVQLPHFDLEIIESANHFYAGVQQRVGDVIRSWILGKMSA